MQDKTDQLQILSQKDSVFFYDYENYNQLEFVNFLLFYFFLQNIKIKLVLQ